MLAALAAPLPVFSQSPARGTTSAGALTTVTLRQDAAAPEQVFAEIGRQGGVSFIPWPGSAWARLTKPLDVDSDRQPFWSITLAAADACGAKLEPASLDENERRVLVSVRDAGDKPGQRQPAGPLLLQAETPYLSKAETGVLELPLTVFADPALRVYRFAEPEIEEAVDDTGTSLLPPESLKRKLTTPPGLITRNSLRMSAPGAGATKIARVRGSITLIVATQRSDWSIDPAQGSVSRAIGKSTYTFVGVAPKEGGYELTLRIKAPAEIDLASPLRDLCVSPQSIECSDAAGHAYRMTQVAASYSTRQITGVGTSEYAIGLRSADANITPGPITSVLWRLPTEVSNIEAPFEFKDILLR